MSKIINVYDAKTHLSEYLEQVAQGGEVRIGKYGKPIAKLVPDLPLLQKPRKLGTLDGKIHMAPNFDEPLMELWDSK